MTAAIPLGPWSSTPSDAPESIKRGFVSGKSLSIGDGLRFEFLGITGAYTAETQPLRRQGWTQAAGNTNTGVWTRVIEEVRP